MIITCRNCKTSFKLSDNLIKDTGSKVKCSKCQFVFRVFPPHIGKEPETLEAEEPAKHSEAEGKRPAEFVSENTSERNFATYAEDRPESDKSFDSPAATVAPVRKKEDLPMESDAAAGDAREKDEYEEFDLSGLDDFFDDEEIACDDESSKESFSPLEDSEPGSTDTEPGKSDELDLSALDELFGDEEVDLDPFPESSESFALSEDRTAPPDSEEGRILSDPETLRESEEAKETGKIDSEEIEALDKSDDTMDLSEDFEEFGELDLSDLDELFGEEDEDSEEPTARESATEIIGMEPIEADAEEEDDADLADLEDFFEEEELSPVEDSDDARAGGEFSETKEIDAGGVSGLELELDTETDEKAPAETTSQEQDAGGDFDFDFDLEMEERAPTVATSEEEEIGGEFEFDFDLEMEDGAAAEATSETQDVDDDFDFDLKLESEEKVADKADSESSEEDDFDFNIKEDATLERIESEEEFDLSDLEQMVDLEEQARAEAIDTEDDLELDFDLENDENSDESTLELEGEDFKFKDSDDSMEVSIERLDDEEDFQLDFEMDEASEDPSAAEQDDQDLEEDDEKIQKSFETITLSGASDMEDVEDELEEPAPYKSNNTIGKILFVVLLVAFVGVAGYYGYGLLKDAGFTIPFIGNGQPETPDPGNLNITAFDLDSKFVANDVSGKLFVITGKARNDYQEPRSDIKISGQLYRPGKNLAQTETIYAGNVISEMELGNLDAETIKERLNNQAGQNSMNASIKPGQAVPFMIVFSDLPEQLEEYTVSVESSSPAQN